MIAPNEPICGSKPKPAALPKLTTAKQAESLLHTIAVCCNARRSAIAQMDAKILAIKKPFEDQLANLDAAIEAAIAQLETFASEHPEIFPKTRKSVEWPAGKFGYRIDPPSLALINRSVTWAKVLAVFTLKRWRRFIRIKREVDKDAILSRCGTLEKPTKFQTKTLPGLGLKLVQEEKFFVEPDLTKNEP